MATFVGWLASDNGLDEHAGRYHSPVSRRGSKKGEPDSAFEHNTSREIH